MSIDIFTFCAQILNLLILLYLLRRFLYLPVLRAVDERQKFIERELKRAASAHKKAVEMEENCRQQLAEIDKQKQEILQQTQQQAEALSTRLTAEAQAQFEKARKQWKQRLDAEQKTFELAVQSLVVDHFKLFAGNALKQMADVSLNDLVTEKLQDKIKALPVRKKQEFAAAYQHKNLITIKAAQKLSAESQQNLKQFLQEQFALSAETKFKFVADSKLVCGVAVQADEQLISWNLAAYLEEFQKNLNNDVQQLVNKG